MKRKSLILNIIKDDLITWKLVYGLNDLGLEADRYFLYASRTLMLLMRIETKSPRWEKIHDAYLDMTLKVKDVDIHEFPKIVDVLAEEIYDFLKQMRNEEKLIQLKDRSKSCAISLNRK